MRRLIWLGTLALLLSPLIAWSREPPSLVPGIRIRITELGAGSSKPGPGTVLTADADTVVLRPDIGGGRVPYSLAGISRLEVSRGRKGHIAAGAGIGFLVGAGIGALLGVSECKAGCTGEESGNEGLAALLVGAIGGGVGMVVGGGIGAIHKTERWEVVPPSRWHVSSWPDGEGGFALALSVRF